MKQSGIIMKLLLLQLCLCVFAVSANATTYKVEAEKATISGCEITSDNKFSGGQAVHMKNATDQIVLSFNVETAGKYKVVVNACGDGDGKVVKCSINGSSATFTANDALTEIEVGTFKLNAGTTKITITPSWTWYYIDYVSLVSDDAVISFYLPSAPVTSDATESALKLYTFLKDNCGKKTVSGMMTGDMGDSNGTDITKHTDVVAVYNASGKYPALVGFDFMFATGKTADEAVASGNTWYSDYSNKAISLAKDLWKRGGIPAFSWHWNDPSRSSSAFYYDTSDSKKTSFNLTTAMKSDGSWNTSSTVYKNMIKDIDKVADYFLQLQDANVACIFRPLHEAPGGWFWWGAQGAEPYKKLYQLVYNEMVNVKGVKNVIWDWNTDYTLTEWNPGSSYYDIASTDIYNDAYDYSSNYIAHDKLKTLTEGKKLISLSECGPIPDIENEVADEAVWTHWMVWYNSWSANFVSKTANTEWKKCLADDRVLTLDKMPGWNNVSAIDEVYSTSSQTATRKCIINNKICIIRNGKTYDVQGRQITK